MFARHDAVDVIEAAVLEHHCGGDLDRYLEGGARTVLIAEIEGLRRLSCRLLPRLPSVSFLDRRVSL